MLQLGDKLIDGTNCATDLFLLTAVAVTVLDNSNSNTAPAELHSELHIRGIL